MYMSEVFSISLHFNKTLLHKSSQQSSLVSGPGLNSSPPEAKNPGIFRGSATTFHYHTIACISHASKVMLKILQARLQYYLNNDLPDVQAGFRKGRGARDQIASTRRIIKKAREFQKNFYFCFIDYAKAFDCVDHNKLWKALKEM